MNTKITNAKEPNEGELLKGARFASNGRDKKISCIICAYNEEPRIAGVLEALKDNKFVDEVIVVDDGSKDNTAKVASSFPFVRVVSYGGNRGKSFAMATGISEAKNDLLMFIDADLVGIKSQDIFKLALPVLQGVSDMSMTLRKNSLLIYRIIGLDFISGERVLPKKLLISYLEEIKKLPMFGIETFMNRLIIKRKMRISVVYWDSVVTPRKSAKVGFWKGMVGDFKMILNIFKTASIWELFYQNYKLRALSKLR